MGHIYNVKITMRYILVGVLLAVCLTVPAYGQSRPNPEGVDTKAGNLPSRPSPKADVCNDQRLKQLSIAEIAMVTNVVEGETSFVEVLEFICKIPNACLQKLSMERPSNLTATEVTAAICACGESNNIIDVIMSTVKQVDSTEVCSNVIQALFAEIKTPGTTCKINSNGIAALTRLSVPSKDVKGCENVNSAVKLSWRRDALSKNLHNMTDEEFQTFFTELAANTDMLDQDPCQVKMISGFVEAKLDFLQLVTARSDLLKMLPVLPGSICKLLSYNRLVELELDAIKTLEWPCVGGVSKVDDRKSQRQVRGHCPLSACGNAIAKTWLAGAETAGAAIAVSDISTTLGNLAKCVSFTDVVQQLSPGQCDGVPLAQNPMDRYKAAKSCKVNKDAQDFTSVDIISMGCYAIKRKLQRINATELCTVEIYDMVRGCLNNTDETSRSDKERTFKILARNCIGDTITLNDVQTLKEIVAYAPCGKLRAIDNTIKTEFMKHFPEDIDASKLSCLPVSDLPVEKRMMQGAAKMTNSRDLVTQVRENLDNVRQILDMPVLSATQLDLILDEILGDRPISELSDLEIINLKWLIVGLQPAEIDAVSLGKIQVIANVLCHYIMLNERQTRAVFTLLMKLKSDSDPENPAGQLSPIDIENLGSTCVLETIRHVNNLTEESLMAACVKFGVSDRLYRITDRTTRQNAADKCFDVLSGNVAQLGNLFFDVSIENINSVDPVDLVADSSSLTKIHCASKEKLTAILDRIATITVNDEVTARIEDTLGLIAFMGSASIADNAQYGPRLAELLQKFEADRICNRMQTDAGREYIGRNIARLLTKVAVVDSTKRKRRATSPISCTVLSSYSADQLKYLTGENIAAIDDFENCIDAFGSVQDWNTEQLTTLKQKFDTYLGETDICNMTSTQISKMGSIGYTLTVAEINCQNNVDLEAMLSLGKVGGWRQDQAKALLDKYMEGENLTPGSYGNLTSTDISTAAHLICGLSSVDAAKIDPAIFKPVIREWSESIVKCSVSSLEGLYTVVSHADAFGAIDEYELNDMGIIAAGIPANQVSSWTSADISALSLTAIQHLTVGRIQNLTPSQLEQFDQNQKIFLNIEETIDTVVTGSHAGKTACSLIMVVMTIICCTLL